jgi:hypothetical protein
MESATDARIRKTALDYIFGQETTTSTHWECECGEHYVWPKNVEECPLCGCVHYECPDAMTSEMGSFRPTLNESAIIGCETCQGEDY